jgi:predicted nuclease of predicted toxin-antitoxin system
MQFLVDECTGPQVAEWLESLGYTVISAYRECRGWDDTELLELAHKKNYILITNDKGFGALIFLKRLNHRGVILLRLDNELPSNKITVLEHVLELHGNSLQDHFTVASEKTIRISQ